MYSSMVSFLHSMPAQDAVPINIQNSMKNLQGQTPNAIQGQSLPEPTI